MANIRLVPFGYKMTNGEIVINEQESAVVKQIFKDYTSGKSFGKISASIATPYSTTRTVWLKSNVARVLENERYTGENGYPKIIDCELFKITKGIRAKQKERNKRKKPKKVAELAEIDRSDLTPQIMKLENTINRVLSQRDFDYTKTKERIFELAALKYQQIGVNV